MPGIELSIESLKLANDVISPRLATTKVLIQSILCSLSPHRSYKKKTAGLAQQAVHVAVKISVLIETTNELPQLVEHYLAQFEEILRDIRLFVQVETQSNTLYRIFCGKIISARYVVLGERLSTLLVHFEECMGDFRDADAMHTGRSRTPPLPLVNYGNAVLPRGEIFPNAHDFIVNGGNYYSGLNFIQQPSHQESGIVQGVRVIAFEDISVSHEIHIGRGYRLHSGNISGKARIVKVYQGPLAKERCLEAAEFHKAVIHPSFLHMIGVSPINSEVPFLVFNGEFKGTLEASIAAALKKDLRNSLMLGLQTVIGLSSGLEYLRDVNYDFISAGLRHFGAFLSLEGRVVISFDPYIVHTKLGEDGHEEEGSSSEVDKALFIFHGLCKQTFDSACQAHYDGQSRERVYDDILDESRFEDVDANSSLENHDSSNPVSTASTLHQTNLDSDLLSTPAPAKKSHGKLPSNGHRRELVWKPESAQNSSLQDILHEFQTFSDSLPMSSGLELYRRRGRYTARTAHRCPGYNRTEITLTPNINRSAIVSHSTPLPHEICPVCRQVVKDAENFNCVCGEEDNESVPTIQCSTCYDWHHRPCVAGSKTMDRFTCPGCSPLIFDDPPESEAESISDTNMFTHPSSELSELTWYSQSNDPPMHIANLWYLNVHSRWQRCQALLYPHMLLLSWSTPDGGRGVVTLDLANCTNAQAALSPSHPLARDDVGTIAASQQVNEGESLADILVPFQMLYSDGVERLAAGSPHERQKWLNRIMDSIHSPMVDSDSVSVVTRSSTESIYTMYSIDSSRSESRSRSRS